MKLETVQSGVTGDDSGVRWMHNPWLAWLAALAWAVGIFTLSGQSTMPAWAPRFDFQDIVGHFVAYSGLALLINHALGTSRVDRSARWTFLAAVLYGATDEFHQYFIPGRHCDPFDLLVDALGAGVMLLGWTLLIRTIRRRPRRQRLR